MDTRQTAEVKEMTKQPIYGPNEVHLSVPEIHQDHQDAFITKLEVEALHDALVTPTNHVFVKGKYVPTGLFTTNDDKKLSYFRRQYFYLKFRFIAPVIRCSGTYLSAFDVWSNNYYHWLCEVLPRLYLMQKAYPQGVVILPESLATLSFIPESLDLLQMRVKWIDSNRSHIYQKLVIVRTSPAHGNVNPVVQSALISAIKNKLDIQPSAGKKIFVSRLKATRRLIENETELHELLKVHGYEIIYTEQLSFAEQVHLFSNAAALVSLHGAGLTNLLFMPAGSKVLEIRDNKWHTNPLCYWRLANVLDLKWSYHLGTTVSGDGNFNNIRVDAAKFFDDFNVFENA